MSLVSAGPSQNGRGRHGQYVYLITMAHPTPENVQQLSLKTPADFTRDSFRELVVEAHAAVGVTLMETVCFREPHENGLAAEHAGESIGPPGEKIAPDAILRLPPHPPPGVHRSGSESARGDPSKHTLRSSLPITHVAISVPFPAFTKP